MNNQYSTEEKIAYYRKELSKLHKKAELANDKGNLSEYLVIMEELVRVYFRFRSIIRRQLTSE